jgi:hypothetical protein
VRYWKDDDGNGGGGGDDDDDIRNVSLNFSPAGVRITVLLDNAAKKNNI